ncbi:hypothetical protein NMP99_01665 [Glutamicibacter mishrai]|uniref:hypothetical protein n=1 Tax=Glutamicibacter mishrai TaxID=1775880 RepID=UPI0020CDD9D9|nr:hypothetical protein [Glutamicibacter mishrai]UTT40046.1 hypothetical protein NMP99_01665 [Glutamicibacter mishrai]
MMKTRLSGALLLLTSVCLFGFALNTAHRDTAMACWVLSTIFFIAAAMLMLGAIVGAPSVTAAKTRKNRQL